jgi:hypothetical protein
MERGTRGTRWAAHQGAGGSVRSGVGSEEQRQLELVARAQEAVKGLGREGKRCGVFRGWCSPFIGAGGAPRRGGQGG